MEPAKTIPITESPPPGLPDISAVGIASTPVGDLHVLPRVDGYDISGRLGSGGMGDVFRATQLSTRREVALKLMRGGFVSESARLRFDREVELTARLDHPNVARVFDSGLRQGIYFYAMELIDGEPLDEYVRKIGLGTRQMLELFGAVCRAVGHAHQRAVIHRDLKPSNILVSGDGQPHVLDFGLAKALARDTAAADVSMEGQWSGTPAFMSPEQAAGIADIDTRTDVYSLGIILYLLMCERFPFEMTGSVAQMVRRVSEAEIPRPRGINPRIDLELESLMLKALAREPNDRYASAGELARDVDNYLRGEPLAAQPATTWYFLRKRLWKNRVGVGVAAAVFAALMTTAIVSYVSVVHARDVAIQAQKKEAQSAKIAGEQRHLAELQRADGLVAEGDTHGRFGEWEAAKSLFASAEEIFAAEGASPKAARIGMWNANRFSPPALNVLPAMGGGAIGAASTSADGRTLAMARADGTLLIRDAATGVLVRSIAAHRGAALCVAISPDARFALSGGADGSAALWDLRDGSLIQKVTVPAGWVTRVVLVPGTQTAITVSGETEATLTSPRDDTLTLWEMTAGKSLRTFNAVGRVSGTAISPDGAQLLTWGQELALWDIATARKSSVYSGTGAGVTAAAFSPDGKFIASGAADSTVTLSDRDAQSESRWKKSYASGNATAVVAVGFSADGRRVYSAGEDHVIKTWEASTGELVREYDGKQRDVRAAAFSVDGRFAFCAAGDNSVCVWGLDDPPEARAFEKASGAVSSVSTSPDGRVAIMRQSLGNSDSWGELGAALWDIATGRRLRPSGWSPGPADSAIFSPDGRRIVTLAGDGVSVWDAGSLAKLQTIPRSPGTNVSASMAFSPDGNILLASAGGSTVSVIDILGGKEARLLRGHAGPVMGLAVSPDGKLALTGSRDRTATIWDLASGQTLFTLRGHKDAVNCVAFTPDGPCAVTAGGNGDLEQGEDDFIIRVWEVRTGSLLRELPGHTRRVRTLAVSPHDALLATAGDDQSVRLWDWQTGKLLRAIAGHTAPVLGLAFVDGAILSAGEDGTPRLWDLAAPRRRDEARAAFELAMRTLQSQPADPVSLAACGKWYAINGVSDWAASLLERGNTSGAPSLLQAQSCWRAGQFSQAAAIFEKLHIATQPQDPYLMWCSQTVQAEHGNR